MTDLVRLKTKASKITLRNTRLAQAKIHYVGHDGSKVDVDILKC